MTTLSELRKKRKIKPKNEKDFTSSSTTLRFITKAEVLYRIGRSNSTLYQMIAADQFPKPFHPYDSRSSFWLESEVIAWMNARLAEAGKEVAA